MPRKKKTVKNPAATGKAQNYSRVIKPEAPLVIKPLGRPKPKAVRKKTLPPELFRKS